MPLEIALVEESDVAEIVEVDGEAMKENGVTQFIDKSLADEGLSRSDFFADYIRPAIKNKTTWKVVDTDTNAMVSVAQWIFQYDTSEPTEKTTIGENKTPPSENMQRTIKMLFAISQEFARTHYLGRPHATLAYLATRPAYQRRGAASMLLEQGLRLADKAGLDSFLHGSAAGLELYKKFGFEAIRTDALELPGLDRVEVRTCMKRPSKIE